MNKPTLLFFLALFICNGVRGQQKIYKQVGNQWYWYRDTTQMVHSQFTISAQDTESEIFSFRMTGDTSKLKPIDTTYYTIANKINREITYRYLVNKQPYYLITRSENSNHSWILFSVQFPLYKKD